MIGVMVATKMLACTKAELESSTHAAATHTHIICIQPSHRLLHFCCDCIRRHVELEKGSMEQHSKAQTHVVLCAAVAPGLISSPRKSLVQASFNSLNLGMLSLDCQPDGQPTIQSAFAM